ncbi:hypothetical protein EVAR_20668_1 [Eumeta japonica]|uniref:Uncharacterized protein n=1 Tax=Eumeta variegata TaxID=151549 RepID=A0A4C1VCF7_EUMVA|nr:hypothetical protein EVAR_20668_1 [Eumeta japonica]
MQHMFTEFAFCKNGPFAQLTGWDLVFLLKSTRLHRVTNSFRGLCVRMFNNIPVDVQSFDEVNVIATRLAGAKEALLIGNINQLSFIYKLNLFTKEYTSPNLVATVTK